VSAGYDTRDAEIVLLKKMLKTQLGRNHGLCQRIDELNKDNKELNAEIEELDEDIEGLKEKLQAKDDWMHKLLELSTAQQKHMTLSYSFQDTLNRLIATLEKDSQLRRADNRRQDAKIAMLEKELRSQSERLALIIDV
jgi:outer membrane murein-binding lipoprotein Lpp